MCSCYCWDSCPTLLSPQVSSPQAASRSGPDLVLVLAGRPHLPHQVRSCASEPRSVPLCPPPHRASPLYTALSSAGNFPILCPRPQDLPTLLSILELQSGPYQGRQRTSWEVL